MLSRFKSALMNAVQYPQYSQNGENETDSDYFNSNNWPNVDVLEYSRPSFLGLTTEETQVSADHTVRPIIVPRDLSRLPWCAGYAECINAGKSLWNEDQAAATRGDLKLKDINTTLPFVMFSMFDGHAGYQVALTARLYLHKIILEKLSVIPSQNLLAEKDVPVKAQDLVVGAIELAYRQMDQMVDLLAQNGGGGCTAITILFLNGRLYACGAGDSRSVLVLGNEEYAITRDHTPDSESNRIRALGYLKSQELLKGQFTSLEFKNRPREKDVGTLVLYREPFMTGWAFKLLTNSDLKWPLVSGHGKRSRVMGTIGVTRGFGDHGLKAANTGVCIKPFLSSQPEVQSFNLEDFDLTERDCVIMATDGLWDVTNEKDAAGILRKTLAPDTPSLEYRLTMGAQELVQMARGRLSGHMWEKKEGSLEQERNDANHKHPYEHGKMASVDDISVLVVPVYPYLCEYRQWVRTRQQEKQLSRDSTTNHSTSNEAQ